METGTYIAPAVTTPGEYIPVRSVKYAWIKKFENIHAAADNPIISVNSLV